MLATSRRAIGTAALLIGSFLFSTATGHAQEQPNAQQPGVEVLTRGPIHEAYAEPVAAQPTPGPVVPRQPPEPIEEMPADERPAGADVQWIPGYWGWDDDRADFVWVSGFWRVPPPSRQWVPGYWTQVAGGWQWVPGYWSPVGQQDVTFLPQPPEPLDAGSSVPAPNEDSTYIPGNWVYNETRYVWRPGFWCNYQPGWMWTPARYLWTPAGYIFNEGYWDCALDRRGLLFAPVAFNFAAWQPNWFYRPSYCIHNDFLMGSLFVRPRWGNYWFGDYFENRYRQAGFVPWIDYRVGRHGYDPLYSYYRWQNRGNGSWDTNLRGLYTGRFNGEYPRPPRTLAQQNTLIQNVTNNVTNVNNVNNLVRSVTAVTPLTKFDRRAVNLQPVTEERRQQERRSAQEFRALGTQRRNVTSQLVAKDQVPHRPTDQPRAAKFELPRNLAVSQPSGTPPALPHRPQSPPATRPELTIPKTRPEVRPNQRPVVPNETRPAPDLPRTNRSNPAVPTPPPEAKPVAPTQPPARTEPRPAQPPATVPHAQPPATPARPAPTTQPPTPVRPQAPVNPSPPARPTVAPHTPTPPAHPVPANPMPPAARPAAPQPPAAQPRVPVTPNSPASRTAAPQPAVVQPRPQPAAPNPPAARPHPAPPQPAAAPHTPMPPRTQPPATPPQVRTPPRTQPPAAAALSAPRLTAPAASRPAPPMVRTLPPASPPPTRPRVTQPAAPVHSARPPAQPTPGRPQPAMPQNRPGQPNPRDHR